MIELLTHASSTHMRYEVHKFLDRLNIRIIQRNVRQLIIRFRIRITPVCPVIINRRPKTIGRQLPHMLKIFLDRIDRRINPQALIALSNQLLHRRVPLQAVPHHAVNDLITPIGTFVYGHCMLFSRKN